MASALSSPVIFDIEAISGICGSISIACWVVVFSPQIIENFRRKSADGLSVAFIIIWLAGDVFNILGAIMQRVLPTMIILAVYYTVADIVLLCQVWWYRGFTFTDEPVRPTSMNVANDTERQPLLNGPHTRTNSRSEGHMRNGSFSSIHRHFSGAGSTHSNTPAPVFDELKDNRGPAVVEGRSNATLRAALFNTLAIVSVCAAGVVGWWVSVKSTSHKNHKYEDDHLRGKIPEFDMLGQVSGYLCAALYLGSRIPQLLLNYRRQSTEGVSLLFFMFACIGNLTYDMSIFAYNPAPYCKNGPANCESGEQSMIYARYIAVNASWIAGSLGTLLLDFGIFVQFFLYKKDDNKGSNAEGDYDSIATEDN